MQETSPKNLPTAMSYVGCAFLVAWFLLFFSGEIWGSDFEHAAQTVVVLSLVSIASCFVTLLLLNYLGLKRGLFSTPLGWRFIILGILLSAGTVGIVLAADLSLVVFIISCMLIGCSGALFICATVLELAQLSPRTILIYSGAFFLGGILIYSFAFYVPGEVTTVILCLLPFLASLFFIMGEGSTAHLPLKAVKEQQAPTSAQTQNGHGWRAAMLLSIFMLFSCVVRGYLPFYIDNEQFSYIRSFSIILMLVLAAVVVIVPALLPTRYNISNLYRGVLILGVVLFALFPIFGMDNSLALVMADGYRGLSAVMALAFFACAARVMPFFGLSKISGGLALYVSFGIIGWLVGSALHYLDPGDDFLRVYSSIQCVVVLLAFILLYRQADFERFIDAETISATTAREGEDQPLLSSDTDTITEYDTMPAEESQGKWQRRVRAIAGQYDLTSREEEVFLLLAKGYKAQNISERLSISYNTTRAHIRNIYQKCDIHSQQEFIALIESALQDS